MATSRSSSLIGREPSHSTQILESLAAYASDELQQTLSDFATQLGHIIDRLQYYAARQRQSSFVKGIVEAIILDLQRYPSTIDNTIAEARSHIDDLVRERRLLSDRHQGWEQELAACHSARDQAIARQLQLQNQFDQANREIEQWKGRHRELRRINDNFQTQLNECRSRVEECARKRRHDKSNVSVLSPPIKRFVGDQSVGFPTTNHPEEFGKLSHVGGAGSQSLGFPPRTLPEESAGPSQVGGAGNQSLSPAARALGDEFQRPAFTGGGPPRRAPLPPTRPTMAPRPITTTETTVTTQKPEAASVPPERGESTKRRPESEDPLDPQDPERRKPKASRYEDAESAGIVARQSTEQIAPAMSTQADEPAQDSQEESRPRTKHRGFSSMIPRRPGRRDQPESSQSRPSSAATHRSFGELGRKLKHKISSSTVGRALRSPLPRSETPTTQTEDPVSSMGSLTLNEPRPEQSRTTESGRTSVEPTSVIEEEPIEFSEDETYAHRIDGRQRLYNAIRFPASWNNDLNRDVTRDIGHSDSGPWTYNTMNAVGTGHGGRAQDQRIVNPHRCAATALNGEPPSINEDGVLHRCTACAAAKRTCWYLDQVNLGDRRKRQTSRKQRVKEKIQVFEVDELGFRWILHLRDPDPDDDNGPGLGQGGQGGD